MYLNAFQLNLAIALKWVQMFYTLLIDTLSDTRQLSCIVPHPTLLFYSDVMRICRNEMHYSIITNYNTLQHVTYD